VLQHKHLLINAKVKDPIKSEDEAIKFLIHLVHQIKMKIVRGPFASYVDVPGNRGLTAIVMIETSHIAFHIWDEQDPSTLQFDLYTCGDLDKDFVLDCLRERFDIVSMDYALYDREVGFKLIETNSEVKGGTN
jgi:S-adenosylmethionine/arginine decarboxylase-like enzyme